MLYDPHSQEKQTTFQVVVKCLVGHRVIVAAAPSLTMLTTALTLRDACVLASTTQNEVLENLGKYKPTFLITTDTLERGSGISLIHAVKKEHQEIKCLLLTDRDNTGVWEDALSEGADGVVPTSVMGGGIFGEALIAISKGAVFYPEVVRDAVQQPTGSGERLHLLNDLTEREKEVLECVADGMSNQEIASNLVVSLPTVKSHISALTGKLQVSSRTQLAVLAIRKGLV